MHHLCNLPEQETLINNTTTQRPKTTPDMVKPENTQPQALTRQHTNKCSVHTKTFSWALKGLPNNGYKDWLPSWYIEPNG